MNKKVRKVSKKKILFVEIDEEITRIFERIEVLPYKELYLVVPRRATLLQSVINLKILKQKLEDIDKTMSIITSDPNGMKLAQQAEIRVFDHWDVHDEKAPKESKKDENSALLSPISATANEVDDSLPNRLPKKKSSIFEVVRSLRGQEKGFSLRSYLQDWKKNRLHHDSMKVMLSGGTKRFIMGFLVTSVAVFFIIVYIVLPGATISIEPASSVITKAVNIDLELRPDDPRSLESYYLETSVELSIDHHATGILSEGQNASGNITVINKSGQEWPLIAETRFQTEDGIVFRLQEAATVPSGNEASPGTLEVYVVADTLDANGSPVGGRGNIGPSAFFLPGLRESSRDNLYAESYTDMTGGETLVSAIVQEEDFVAAREKLEEQIREKALSSLRKEALSQANQLGVDLKLLEDSDVLQYGSVLVDIPYELLGQEMETFELTGTLELSGVAYDATALLEILKTEIVSAETPGKQLIRIKDDSVSIEVIEFENTTLNYTFTAQIQGIEEYEIDPESEGGSKLAKKIKEHIAGKNIEEASDYIQNLPEVNSVDISIWPTWSPTIPTLPENIKIKSLSQGEAIELEEAAE